MSESNNNTPMRITQLEEATAYEDGMYYAVAKAGGGTKKIDTSVPNLADKKIIDATIIEKEVTQTVDISTDISFTAGYITANGTVGESTTYSHSELIEVIEGDIFENTRSVYRFICAYDSNMEPVQSKGSDSQTNTYTVPEGIKYVVFSIQNGYVGYPDNLIRTRTTLIYENSNTPKLNLLGSCVHGDALITATGDLVEGSKLTIETNSIRKNYTMRFYGKFSRFAGIIIGHGETGSYSEQFKVDDTNIYIGINNVFGNGIPHNLTINVYICVTVKIDTNCIATYKVETLGGSYSRTVIAPSYYVGRGKIYVESIESRFSKCIFTYNSEYQKNKWLFGDSYLTNYSESRWVYYLQNWGYDNFLLNAYPGEASADGYSDLLAALQHGKPKYIIWCYGMNDPDNGSINSTWKTAVDNLIDICNDNEITPILATIPNVPTLRHDYKNDYIRSLGYRYIDFAASVVADASMGTWYSGLLSNDGVHPTAEGAKMLACRALADFPEFMQN